MAERSLTPTGILVDTSAWVELLRDTKSPTAQALERLVLDGAPICLTGVVLAELLRGCPTDADASELEDKLVSWPVYEPRFPQSYELAARLHRDARKRGKTVRSTIDCILAAIAIENRLAVLHHDRDYCALAAVSELRLWAV